MSGAKLSVLGTFQLEVDDRPVTLPTRKTTALLCYVAIGGGRYTRESLATLLWPDSSTPDSRSRFRTCLHRLRSVVPSPVMQADRLAVWIPAGAPLWTDAGRLSELASSATESGACTTTALEEAFELYRGRFLSGFSLSDSAEFDNWQLMQAEHWELRARHIFRRLAGELLRARRFEEAIDLASRWLIVDDLDEEAHRTIMQAAAELGDRAEALRQYRRCEEAVRTQLSAKPDPATEALYNRIRVQSASRYRGGDPNDGRIESAENWGHPPAGWSTIPHSLSTFVGRKAELAELRTALAGNRLVTVVGVGGSGKTRTCLELLTGLEAEFPGGIWWIDLAPAEGSQSPERILAETLGLKVGGGEKHCDAAARFLMGRIALLVMDNCEHLAERCAALSQTLLSRCPKLRILVTSRRSLSVTGERVYHLPCLPVPAAPQTYPIEGSSETIEIPADASVRARLLACDSIQLFVDRSRLRERRFTDQELSKVAEVCRAVEGMPLAIEMAAARTESMSIERIRRAVNRSAAALISADPTVSARHRSIVAVLQWSVSILPPGMQLLFRRCAVFRGWFTFEDACAVLVGPTADAGHPNPVTEAKRTAGVQDALSDFATCSLIVARHDRDETRYRMLEPVRRYAWTQLGEQGGLEACRARHAARYREVCVASEPLLFSRRQVQRLPYLDAALANIWAAIAWFGDNGDWENVVTMITCLLLYWRLRSHGAVRWLNLAIMHRESLTPPTLARALIVVSYLAHAVAVTTFGKAYAAEALEIARESGNQTLQAFCLLIDGAMSNPATTRAELAHSVDRLTEAAQLFRALGHDWGVAESLLLRGLVNTHTIHPGPARDVTSAETDYRAARELSRKAGILSSYADVSARLGALLMMHSPDEAGRLFREAIAVARRVGAESTVGNTLFSYAWMDTALGEFASARRKSREALRRLLPSWDPYMIANSLWMWGVAETYCGDGRRGLAAVMTARLYRRERGIHTRHLDAAVEKLKAFRPKENWDAALAEARAYAEGHTIHDSIADVLSR